MKLNKKLETQLVLYNTLSNNQILLNELNKTIKERDQHKAERDSLIDDIAVLKADNEKYKKRAENAMDYAERSQCEVLRLKQENKDLRLQADTYFDEWQKSKLKAQAFDRIKKHVDEERDSFMVLYRETKDPTYSLLNSHYDTLLGYIEEQEQK